MKRYEKILLGMVLSGLAITAQGAPTIENDSIVSGIGFATLLGDLQADDSEATTVKVYWGLANGGTTAANWANTNEMSSGQFVGIKTNTTTANLIYGLSYFYRYFASNSVGAAWSSTSDSFTTYRQNIGTNGIMHHGYHTGPNGVMFLDNNDASSMMGGGDPLLGPTYNGSALVTDGPGSRGLDFDNDADFAADGAVGQADNYSSMFLGYFVAPQTGDYEFQSNGDDDRSGIWLDLDQDGIFESSAGGFDRDDGEQLAWEDSSWHLVSLTTNERYRVAFTHSEGGGGSRCEFRVRGPGVTGSPKIKPSEAGQAGFWLYDIANPLNFSFDNAQVSNVAPGTAYLNATLTAEEQRYDVTVFWHTTDYGTNKADWIANGSSALVGSYTNVSSLALTYQATGLAADSTYYYTYYLSNAVEEIFAQPSSSFASFGTPVVSATGETFADLGRRTTLNGNLTGGGAADMYLAWGRVNAGTTDTSLWENVVGVSTQTTLAPFSTIVTGLTFGVTYYYACYATNSLGSGWSSVDSWVIGKGIFVSGGLRHYGYHAYNTADMNLHNNGGMLNSGNPTNYANFNAETLLTTGPGGRGLDFDSDTDFINSGAVALSDYYQNLFLGYLYAAVDGVYEFKRNGDDDRMGIWLDLDQDRVFQSSPTGLGSDRNEQLQWDGDSGTKSKTLTAGYYRFAAIHGENTGGSSVDIRFKSPSMGSQVAIKPSGDANQAGNWYYESELNVGITNSGVSNIILGQVDLTGTLFAEEAEYMVWVYWSTNNGGTSKAAWLADGSVQYMEGFTNIASTTLVHQITGLSAATTYYYNFYASNAAEEVWGNSYLFGSAGPPTVENTGGAEVGIGTATMNGSLTTGGTATVFVAWGTSDGGTSTSAWDTVVNIGARQVAVMFSNVTAEAHYGQTYYYRCYATNEWGSDWSDSATTFASLQPGGSPQGVTVTANLEAWYDAGFGVLTNGSGTVTNWPDRSVNGRTLVLDSGTPTVAADEINGRPAINFNNDSELLSQETPGDEYFSKETWLAFRSGQADTFRGWGAPFGSADGDDADRSWMFENNTARYWNSEPPAAVNHNGTSIPNGGDNRFNMVSQGSMSDFMVLRVVTGPSSSTQIRPYVIGTRNDQWASGRYYTAEILAYNSTNTLADREAIGGYLAYKYGITTTYTGYDPPNGSTISNTLVSGILPGQATLNTYVTSTNAIYYLTAFWSTNDYGTNAAAWLADGSSAGAGTITNENRAASYTVPGGLTDDTVYYYTFRGTNESTEIWGDPSASFSSVGPPGVTNTGATAVGIGTATFNGVLTNGGGADITFVYGNGDAGTGSPSDWDYTLTLGAVVENDAFASTVSNLYYGIGYNYRIFASNAVGTAWSAAESFNCLPLLTEPQLTAAGQTFQAYFEDYDGESWLLIGRGREGWDFDSDGQGSVDDVALYIGTTNAFSPACYSDSIVTDLFDQASISLGSVTMRVMRASETDGSGTYQDLRWYAFTGFPNSNSDFTFGFDDASKGATIQRVNAPAGLSGASTGTGTDDIRDHQPAGNDADRMFTWAWGSHNNQKGFCYGQTQQGVDNNDNDTFIWEYGTEAHSIPYTEVYIPYPEPEVGALTVTNTAASSIEGATADIGGTLNATGSVLTVYAYWGPNDNANSTAWLADVSAQNVLVGTYTNVLNQSLSAQANGLTQGTDYYYTFVGTNVSTNIWATPNASFTTVDTPYVNNSTGATPVSATSATVRGLLTTGVLATASIYWGPQDGGIETSDWANVVSIGSITQAVEFSSLITGLSTNMSYWYRSYVSNAVGGHWAVSPTYFSGSPINGGPGSESYAKIDIGATGHRVDTAAGWQAAPGNGEVTATAMTADTGDSFTFALDDQDTADTDVGAIDPRDRGDSTSTDDLVYTAEDHSKNNSGVLRVSLGSLPADIYEVTSYHLDPGFSQSDQIEVKVSTDGGSTYSGVLSTGTAGTSIPLNSLTTANIESSKAFFSFTANGTDDVMIVFDGRASADNETPLNGLVITNASAGAPIANLAPSAISTNQATARAQLTVPVTNYTVYVHWGSTDGGTNAMDWDNSYEVGGWTNVALTNISAVLTNLAWNTPAWYTFRASNSTDQAWAEPSWNFSTLPYAFKKGTIFNFR